MFENSWEQEDNLAADLLRYCMYMANIFCIYLVMFVSLYFVLDDDVLIAEKVFSSLMFVIQTYY